MKKILDRYFYAIEQGAKGKVFHLLGNIYLSDKNTMQACYRIAEWTDVYLTMEQAMNFWDEDIFFSLSERISFLADITADEAKYIFDTYFEGKRGKHKNIEKIDADTQCGYYWFNA